MGLNGLDLGSITGVCFEGFDLGESKRGESGGSSGTWLMIPERSWG